MEENLFVPLYVHGKSAALTKLQSYQIDYGAGELYSSVESEVMSYISAHFQHYRSY
jgi:hypothetical protein